MLKWRRWRREAPRRLTASVGCCQNLNLMHLVKVAPLAATQYAPTSKVIPRPEPIQVFVRVAALAAPELRWRLLLKLNVMLTMFVLSPYTTWCATESLDNPSERPPRGIQRFHAPAPTKVGFICVQIVACKAGRRQFSWVGREQQLGIQPARAVAIPGWSLGRQIADRIKRYRAGGCVVRTDR